jgi:Xaa-Pro aminopeptidase
MTIYHDRLEKVRRVMEEQEIDLLVLPPSPYMYYLTGIREDPYFVWLKGPGDWLNGVFIGLADDPLLVVNWEIHRLLLRHTAELSPVVSETRVLEQEADPQALLESVLAGFGLWPNRIAVPDRTWARFMTALQSAAPDAEMYMASNLLDDLIATKDEHALSLMRKVSEITDNAYRETLDHLHLGVSEEEIALEVDYQFRKAGAEGNSFASSVIFTRPGDDPPTPGKRLQAGDSVVFDIGAVYAGYCSDFGRSAFAGEPPPEYLRAHELVLEAQAAGMRAMKAGVTTCEQVVEAVQQVLRDGGYGRYLIPACGHAIGLTVHELPLLFMGDRTTIQAGMTFTVEPTLRVPGRFSNRVEDIVLVTADGAEYLTVFPRDLHIIAL